MEELCKVKFSNLCENDEQYFRIEYFGETMLDKNESKQILRMNFNFLCSDPFFFFFFFEGNFGWATSSKSEGY